MKVARLIVISAILMVTITMPAFGWADWHTLKTEHFTVFYHAGRESEARQVLQTLEHYRPRVEELCGNKNFHLPVVIEDIGAVSNGFDNPTNYQIHLYSYPPDSNWTGVENWWAMVGVHEYTHQLSLSQTSGIPGVLQGIFGNFNPFLPNTMAPLWTIEGITVYSESQLSPYQGRLNDGLFDAYIKARGKEGRLPSLLEATYFPVEFQLESYYTYGGKFFDYLAKTYGEARFAEFFKVNGSSIEPMALALFPLPLPAIGLDRSARRVFGKSFPRLWQDWQQYETEQANDYQIDGEQVTSNGWNTANPVIAGEKLYYQKSYPVETGAFQQYRFAEIIERNLKTGREKVFFSTTAAFNSGLKIRDNQLFFTTAETKTGFDNATEGGFGVYSLLHRLDLTTGSDKIILKEGFRSFEVRPDGSILYATDIKAGFGSELWLFQQIDRTRKFLFKTDYIVDQIVSDGEKILVSARQDWANFSIYQMDLTKGSFTPVVDTPFTETNPVLLGEKLLFQANYGKVAAIYSIDFSTGAVSRMTNGGFANSPAFDPATQTLYFVGLHSAGFDIYKKPAEFSQFQLPEVAASKQPEFTLAESRVEPGGYWDNLKTMAPKVWSPYFRFDNTNEEIGIFLTGSDAVGDFPYYDLIVGYDYQTAKPFTALNLEVNMLAPLTISLFYDNLEDSVAGMKFGYPVYTSLSPGLNRLTIGSSLTTDPDYDGPELAPYFELGIAYPKTSGNLTVSAPVSQNRSGGERSALYSSLAINQYLPGSELRFKAISINDPDNPDWVFETIRGYQEKLRAKQGKVFSLEYSRPLLEVRRGLWNPNIYFEDLTATLFTDEAIPEQGARQWSWGLEFHVETKTLYSVALDWGLRISRNQEGENRSNLFIKSFF